MLPLYNNLADHCLEDDDLRRILRRLSSEGINIDGADPIRKSVPLRIRTGRSRIAQVFRAAICWSNAIHGATLGYNDDAGPPSKKRANMPVQLAMQAAIDKYVEAARRRSELLGMEKLLLEALDMVEERLVL